MFNFDSYSNSHLSFEPNEFHDENFSVDEFIQRKRQNVPLDVLRDDLGSHLKFLRSSLIELINHDYGHFLNLSANLVGLDGRIQNIITPLTRAKSDLEDLCNSMNFVLDQINGEMAKQKALREIKNQLGLLKKASKTIHSAERALDLVPEEILTSSDFSNLKCACEEIAESKYLLFKCADSPLKRQLDLRLESSKSSILRKLSNLLQIYGSLESSTSETSASVVKSILQMYSELEAEVEAEKYFVEKVLKPKSEGILTKKGNIFALLEDMELFIQNCPLLVTSRALVHSSSSSSWIVRYDFISRGVFPHVFSIMVKHFPHIWSPSNPEAFHTNWTRCEKFISTLESSLSFPEQVEYFRSSESFKEFTGKWQFPVYFQLRFHTLAIELESAIDTLHSPCSTQDFQLDVTRVMIRVVNQCWDKDKIFISQLAGRFLKASTLFISRYLNEIKREIEPKKDEEEVVPLKELIKLNCIILNDLDISELLVIQILKEKLEMREISSQPKSQEFLTVFTTQWDSSRNVVESRLVEKIVSESCNEIGAVTEVPRLFRRTKRESPTKRSEYVVNILAPILSLKEIAKANVWERVGEKICHQVLQRYNAQVKEVLLSVQRMEESLKRLKKVKGGQDNQQNKTGALSDDDKIRQQIQIDVDHLISKMKEVSPNLDTTIPTNE